MGQVERGVIKPPNDQWQGLAAVRGMGDPHGSEANTMPEPNQQFVAGDPRGSQSLARQTSPVAPPDHRFLTGNAGMSQPPSAVTPGKGSLPVEPFTPLGSVARVRVPQRDTAAKPSK